MLVEQKVTVRSDHISRCNVDPFAKCPITLAIREHFRCDYVSVGKFRIVLRIGKNWYTDEFIPTEIQLALDVYENLKVMHPFSFTLKLQVKTQDEMLMA